MPTTIADLNALVAEHGGRCVSKQYLDTRHALTWECKLGHRFRRHVGVIRSSGWWCPQCRTMSGSVAKALKIAAGDWIGAADGGQAFLLRQVRHFQFVQAAEIGDLFKGQAGVLDQPDGGGFGHQNGHGGPLQGGGSWPLAK